MAVPAAVDVCPRAAEPWELRVTVLNVEEATLHDLGWLSEERSSDLFIRGHLAGNAQKTDIHYRSVTGEVDSFLPTLPS